MSTYVDSGTRTDSPEGRVAPAYGPVDAALGYALFYVLVDRATPTVVDVVTDAIPGVSPSLVGVGLAALLWFVLAVTVVDQARRQLAAIGVVRYDPAWGRPSDRVAPSESRALAYLVGLLVGGLVAAWTYAGAIGTAVSLIRAVAALDWGAFLTVEFVAMVVFFVAYSVASRSLDRLAIGGLRTTLAG